MMQQTHHCPEHDVAIVGLGPVGATLANLLGRLGLRVLILEREDEAYGLPRAVHFDDECMRVFQAAGLADEMAAITAPSKGMRYVDAEGSVLIESPVSQELTQHGWRHGYRFHQPDLEAVLSRGLARWPNVQVMRRADVFALEQCERDVCVRFEDLSSGRIRSVRATFVVGCDGARSTVRRFIGSGWIDLGFHERWLVADLLLKVPRPDLGEISVQHCNPARSSTYVSGLGNRRRWEIRLQPDETSKAMMQPQRLWQLLAQWLTPDEADIERQAVYTFHSALAETWRAGRLFLAGDSAHQTPPFLGQGMCAGIRDASNLAWKLAAVIRRRACDTLLDSYQQERASHVREYIELAVALGGVINTTAMNPVLPNSTRTDGNSIRLNRQKPMLGRGFAFGCSALIGRQIPQPVLSDGCRLDEVVGQRFCLLVASGHAEQLTSEALALLEENGVQVIADTAPKLQRWLAETGHAAILVRPDRYVCGGAETTTGVLALLVAAFERPAPPFATASHSLSNSEVSSSIGEA
jgi:3-(3-hydroxy-phenyl)propionate hydroxylase